MFNGLVKIDELLECSLCHLTLRQTRIVAECGHRFCKACITQRLRKNAACPICNKAADARNLRKDPMHDNLVVYVSQLKQALLPHSLTPLELSLQNKSGDLLRKQDEVDTKMVNNQKIDNVNFNNNIKDPDSMSSSTATGKKRQLGKDTEDNEAYDSIQMSKKAKLPIKPVNKQQLFDPKAMLEDILPNDLSPVTITPSPLPTHRTTPTVSQANRITPSPGSKVTPTVTTSPKSIPLNTSENGPFTPLTTDASLQTGPTNTTASKELSTSSVIDEEDSTLVPAVFDVDKEDQEKTWRCTKCHYQNQPYIQTCIVCSRYRKGEVLPIQDKTDPDTSSPSTEKQSSKAVKRKEKEGYKLTVPGENNTVSNDILTAPTTRRRSEETSKLTEAHVIYTGLTPEDEKKLNKIKEEVASSRLKLIIHYHMRDFDEVTHVITSVDSKKLCKRTLKYLQGLLEGKWVVEPSCKPVVSIQPVET
ncbi:hypothetical protein BDF20DRAFT_868959 [Mycotypha africana]|uniref:uncharacterized protein n=1 Tax=Mycotypha africana TaxID=64632 RepID=UPI002300672C|nr:uncharacterized protein BDF20DRAFT_868959 [Mycotypha africana]KAI8979337.1 hypothetical protein BDF20DRAFT_868959 [Mycotypha africana]